MQGNEINEREYIEAMRPAFPDVVESAEQHIYSDYVPDSNAAPVDLDGPQYQAYVAAKEAEQAASHPNSVVADTPTLNQPGPTEF